MHTRVTAVQLLPAGLRSALLRGTGNVVYVGMPGNAARAFGLADNAVGPFGKPWACKDDPRGWLIAYREYLWTRIRSDADFALAVRDLHGKTLACWCKAKVAGTKRRDGSIRDAIPDCHADSLAAASEWLFHGIEAAR